MKKLLLGLLLFFGAKFITDAQTVTRLFGSSPFQDSLWAIDTTNWQVTRRMGPTPSSGGTITGMTGMAKDPLNGDIYIICKQSAQTGRSLGKLNPTTGLITIIGNLGQNFSSLTFTSNGRLFGATGNGSTTSEGLFSIDKTTAVVTLIKVMGNGADGEIICANPDDNDLLYHWSGNGTIVYEKLDTITGPYTPTNIPIIGTTTGETFGAVYIGNGTFITSNISSSFNRFTVGGNVTPSFGSNPDDLRGLVIVTCSRAVMASANAFCPGGSSTLTSGANYFVGAYQWYQDGVLIPGATSQSYTTNTPGHFNCIVTDPCGTDSSGTGMDIMQYSLPSVTISSGGSFCGSTTLNANAPSGTYQWYMDGTPIGGATFGFYFTSASGLFNMICTDVNGCTDSAAVGSSVIINPLPTVVIGPISSYCGSTTLDAGNVGATYLWSDNSTGQTLLVTGTGTYSVTVTDGNGCSNWDSTTVNINSLPTVALGVDITQCGGSVLLDAQNAGSSYLWNDASTSQTLSASTSGSYFVSVTDANGCVNGDTIMVTINSIPTVTASATATTVCFDDGNVSLTGSPSGGVFSGTGVTGSSFDPSVAGNGAHVVSYDFTDVNGCSATGTVTINVNPCTGVIENSVNGMDLYPNPANDNVSLTLSENAIVTIYSTSGAIVMTAEMKVGKNEIDLSAFANGAYFVRATLANGVATQQLIIAK